MDIPMSIVIEKTSFGLGFTLKDEGKPYESTALVTKVARGSSAEASGLRIGDRIVAINQKPVKSMTFLEVSNFLRSGSDRNIQLTLLHKPLDSDQLITDTICELSPPKILTSSNIANGIQNISLKESNSPIILTTNSTTDIYKDEMKNLSDDTSPIVVSISQSNRPIAKPRTTVNHSITNNNNNNEISGNLFNSEDIENLNNLSNNLLQPVLSQLQESEFHNSPTSHLLSHDFLSSNESRKENSYPLSPNELMHNITPIKNDIHQSNSLKSIDPNLNTLESSSTKKSGFDSVRIIRKHTMDPSMNEDPDTDTIPVRFVRKRAYASARHPGRYDQVKTLTSMNVANSTTKTTTTTTITENQSISPVHYSSLSKTTTSHTSPCQLLPAVNVSHKNSFNDHSSSAEPKIIHLPKRRSSTGIGGNNNNNNNNNVIISQTVHSKHYMVDTLGPTRVGGAGGDHIDYEHDYMLDKQNGTFTNEIFGKNALNLHETNISYSSPKDNSSIHYHGVCTSKSNYTTTTGTVASHASSKTSLLSSRLWASFDQDQNESVSELWTRAGEVYHILEQETQRLANKKTTARTIASITSTATTTTTTTISGSTSSSSNNRTRHYPGTLDHCQLMTNLSNDHDKITNKNLQSSSQPPYYSSPAHQNYHKNMLSTKTSHYSSHTTESNRDQNVMNPTTKRSQFRALCSGLRSHRSESSKRDRFSSHSTESNRDQNVMNPTTKRSQFRALCSGLRSHRSESNILCDLSGSFLSRQCFCKILAIGGSDNKSYSWKPYYMCVSGAEVKFIKASWAFYKTGRTNKSSKSKDDFIYPRNNSLSNLRDHDTVANHREMWNTSKSHDELNDDSISYHYYHPTYCQTDIDADDDSLNPVNNTTTTTTINTTISTNKSYHIHASCLILPIPGLVWCSEQLPTNFPNWLPLGHNYSTMNHNGSSSSSNNTQTLISRTVNHHHNNNNNLNNGIYPDWMDPHVSGLSQQQQQQQHVYSDFHDYCYKLTTSDDRNHHSNTGTNEDSRSKFRCFRFAHIPAGVELLFVFPDENAAMACLKMCQLFGGRDYDANEHHVGRCNHSNASTLTKNRRKSSSSSSNPYELFFLKLSSQSYENSVKSIKKCSHHFALNDNYNHKSRPPLTISTNSNNENDNSNDDGDDDIVRNDYTGDNHNNIDNFDYSMHRNVFIQPPNLHYTNADSPCITTTYGPYCLMKDRRRLHRRYVVHRPMIDSDYTHSNLIADDVNTIKNPGKNNNNNVNKSEVVNKFWLRVREKIDLDGIQSDNSESMTTDISSSSNSRITTDVISSNNNSNNNNIDDKSQSINIIRTNKLLRGFKQWLQRPVGGVNTNNNSNNNTSSSNSISNNNNNTNPNCSIVGSMNFSTANHLINTVNNVAPLTTGYFGGGGGGGGAGPTNSNTNQHHHHHVNINNNWELSSTVDVSHAESPNNEQKFCSITIVGDPPNMTDLDSSGPVFGAPLELQLESPDYPCVPVLLQAIVIALELHGLHLSGLYRKPGRHRTIAQFVSTLHQHPDDIDLMFSLDAWREPNALCGLFKHYLRRLPVGLFSLSSWEPLFCLVPEITNSSDMKQLAYLLLSIRVQLKKMAFDAFGIPTMNTMPVDVQNNSFSSTDISISYHHPFNGLMNSTNNNDQQLFKSSLTISPPISPQPMASNDFQSKLKLNQSCTNTLSNKQSFRVWRWATLCFIMDHIMRVVAHEHCNAVTYQCIAICFGPVFFGNSSKLPKLNEVLEHLFRHWYWLIDNLPMITNDSLTNIDLSSINNEPTLLDAITYLTANNTTATTSTGTTTAAAKFKHHKKSIFQDQNRHHHRYYYHHPIQRSGMTHETINNNDSLSSPTINSSASSTQHKSTDVIHVEKQSSTLSSSSSTSSSSGEHEQQAVVEHDLTVNRFDNEDELNEEVIKQVRSLWLKALEKALNAQSHKNAQINEKSTD
ncbi:unnamed protein product [Schistosoma turkestanicum]|nr:unnamed protein product [Schistosoma turkestanicum]